MTGMTLDDVRACVDIGADDVNDYYTRIVCETGTGAIIMLEPRDNARGGWLSCDMYLPGVSVSLAWAPSEVDKIIAAMGGIVGIVGIE